MTRRGAFAVTLAILLGPHAALGQPDDKQACTDAYVANQKLRKDGKLTLAREQLLLCAQEGCPGPIKADCVKWLGDLEGNIPTIVIDAKDRDGSDTTAVRVLVDGQKVADKLDGRPLAIDPGEHTLRFEHDGADPIEKRIVVQQGSKNRSMSVSFATATATAPAPDKNGDTPTPETSDDGPPVHWAVVAVIGVLSIGAFATFAGFGVTGKNDADELDRTCGENAEDPNLVRTCTDEQIEDVRTKLIVADVMLGVGVATAAVAIGLLIWNVAADSSSTAVEVHLGPTVGGAYGGVGLRF